MKLLLKVFLVVLCLDIFVAAQTPPNHIDDQVKPIVASFKGSAVGILYTKKGRIAMAISCDELPETMWSVDNPAYLLMSKLSEVLAEGLTKK